MPELSSLKMQSCHLSVEELLLSTATRQLEPPVEAVVEEASCISAPGACGSRLALQVTAEVPSELTAEPPT
jgi:hypothetical protein